MTKPSLYEPTILDHAQHPRHYVKLSQHTNHAQGYNPQCGDHLEVFFYVQDKHIKYATFHGEMCALCKASASMMTHILENEHIDSIIEWVQRMDDLTAGKEHESMGSANKLAVIQHYPARAKCVTLPWYTALHALEEKEGEATTE